MEKLTEMQQTFSKDVDAKLVDFNDTIKTILYDIKGLVCDLEVKLIQQKHKIEALTTSLKTRKQKCITLEAL